MSLTFPHIDPVALQIGPLAIRWYALAYLAGIIGGWRYALYLAKKGFSKITPLQLDDFIVWATLGIVLGGRLGYVLFYKPAYYSAHPIEILHLWQGGMSFHGGLLGVILAMFLFTRKNNIPFFRLSDLAAAVTPIGLFFGRIANFINGELYGRTTDATIGMIFPNGGFAPRHPSQLYEALGEGILLFVIMQIFIFKFKKMQQPGFLSGAFLCFYAMIRFIIEFFREPDAHLGFIIEQITLGQILTLPMLIMGIIVIRQGRT